MRVSWSSACHVVAKILKCSKHFSKVSRLVTTKLLTAHVWHWVSRISWIVRNLCVTDGTTWRKLCVTLPSWQSLCQWNGTTWHAILRDTAGTKFVPVWGLLNSDTCCNGKEIISSLWQRAENLTRLTGAVVCLYVAPLVHLPVVVPLTHANQLPLSW